MKYGYARISDKSQQIATQVEQLNKYGCDAIIEEQINGKAKEKKLYELIKTMKKGDMLVATRVDRLGRSTLQLLKMIDELEKRGIGIVILDVGMDTSTPVGKALLAMLSAFAQMEYENNKIKQKNGIDAARRRGVHLGKKGNFNKTQLEEAIRLYQETELSLTQIENLTSVSRATLYRHMQMRGIEKNRMPVVEQHNRR
ncbi:recombinase family protein [Bacillus firmus]|uniref:recombinase family protein n=1 Tax=Cytobacillus TaxID=2675230 RepID=UPI0011A11BFC|nr:MULTISPECIES: recombinase family protein [Cytobacillus]MBZ9534533.1 recombinase family protein [Cytobacillus oceanisediminis]MDD9310712.1 recombinase family protein [Cytobacillus firmus]NUH82914.1 recombinase family protein [Cytobacillus firmus]